MNFLKRKKIYFESIKIIFGSRLEVVGKLFIVFSHLNESFFESFRRLLIVQMLIIFARQFVFPPALRVDLLLPFGIIHIV